MVIGEIETLKQSGGLKIKKMHSFVDSFSYDFYIGGLH